MQPHRLHRLKAGPENNPPPILEEGEKQTVKPNSGQVDFWQSYALYRHQHRTVLPPFSLSIAVSCWYLGQIFSLAE